MGDIAFTDTMIKDGLWDAFNGYHMGRTAENVAEKWRIGRQEQDEFAAASQARAGAAQQAGRFADDGTVTAGNASGINDGAAALVLMRAGEAERRGISPLARIVSWATAGVDPALMGSGPIPASRRALDKAGWTIGEVDVNGGGMGIAMCVASG